MISNKSRDTTPELSIRRRLHAQGLRYRVNFRPLSQLRRTADIAFTKSKLAIFIDGCFWHSCPIHGSKPKNNQKFWSDKFKANVARDRDTNQRLSEEGWTVLRYWEHDPPGQVTEEILLYVRHAQSGMSNATTSLLAH